MGWESDTSDERTTDLKGLKHVRKLVIVLLDLLQQVLAQKHLLDASDFVILFQGCPDPIQITEVR